MVFESSGSNEPNPEKTAADIRQDQWELTLNPLGAGSSNLQVIQDHNDKIRNIRKVGLRERNSPVTVNRYMSFVLKRVHFLFLIPGKPC